MKKILLSICIALITISGFSQVASLYGEVNMVTGTVANDPELQVSWEVINATSGTLDFGCKRMGVQEVPGATNQFCWGTICSPFGTGNGVSSEIVTLAASESTSSFYAHYRHNGNPGQSIIRYCWYDVNNVTNEYCFNVNYCVDSECIVSVAERASVGQIDKISPNPINNTGNITYSFLSVPNSGKLTIYNMVGSIVKQVTLTKKAGAVIINANDFENGIYFCNIENGGKVFETKRFVIAK